MDLFLSQTATAYLTRISLAVGSFGKCIRAAENSHTAYHGSLIGKPLWSFGPPNTDALLFSMCELLDGASLQCIIVQLELNVERGEFDASDCSVV